jgi:hypothetical protein
MYVAEIRYALGSKCSGKQGHIAGPTVAENRDISINHVGGGAGSVEEESSEDA